MSYLRKKYFLIATLLVVLTSCVNTQSPGISDSDLSNRVYACAAGFGDEIGVRLLAEYNENVKKGSVGVEAGRETAAAILTLLPKKDRLEGYREYLTCLQLDLMSEGIEFRGTSDSLQLVDYVVHYELPSYIDIPENPKFEFFRGELSTPKGPILDIKLINNSSKTIAINKISIRAKLVRKTRGLVVSCLNGRSSGFYSIRFVEDNEDIGLVTSLYLKPDDYDRFMLSLDYGERGYAVYDVEIELILSTGEILVLDEKRLKLSGRSSCESSPYHRPGIIKVEGKELVLPPRA